MLLVIDPCLLVWVRTEMVTEPVGKQEVYWDLEKVSEIINRCRVSLGPALFFTASSAVVLCLSWSCIPGC